MQALAMHSDEKLQCAMSFTQLMLIALHPNSHIKMRFFFFHPDLDMYLAFV